MDRTIVAALICGLMVAATAGRAGDPAGSGNAAQPDYAGLFTRLEQADAVVEGARPAKSLLYVLFDANCYYCQLTWKALQAYETAGLQVHWVPVAFQQASSVGRAAAIMQAANRGAALRENETGYKVAQFDGGIRPLDKTPAELAARFEANTRLMRSFGAPGTPSWSGRTAAVGSIPGSACRACRNCRRSRGCRCNRTPTPNWPSTAERRTGAWRATPVA